jgi:hypothetical protein
MVTKNGVRSIPIKDLQHALPKDDDELDSFYNNTPREVEPNNPTTSITTVRVLAFKE